MRDLTRTPNQNKSMKKQKQTPPAEDRRISRLVRHLVEFEVILPGEKRSGGVYLDKELFEKINPVRGELRTDGKSKRFFCKLNNVPEEIDSCLGIRITGASHNSAQKSHNDQQSPSSQ
jgi:hypothetical protein